MGSRVGDVAARSGLIAALVALGLVLVPATASAAGRASVSNGKLVYEGGGENNSVSLSIVGGKYNIYDSALSSVAAGPGCVQQSSAAGSFPEVSCTMNGVTEIVIRTKGGDDVAQVPVGTTLPSKVKLTAHLGTGRDSWSGSRATGDIVYGGDGNDFIETHGGKDRVFGGDGNDTVNGGNADDFLSGERGADTVSGGAGDDTLRGDGGNDKLYGFTGRDSLRGGAGRDLASGGLGRDVIDGGDGSDRLQDDHRGQQKSFLSPDTLIGGRGIDTADYDYRVGEITRLWLSIDGRANDGARNEGDNITRSVENIIGGRRSDVIVGSDGANTLAAREGVDVIRGRGGRDRLHGDGGADRLEGGGGDDRLEGWWGDDTIIGGGGTDFLQGGVDGDVLIADDGQRDTASCGGGIDRAIVDGRDGVTRLCERVVRR